MTEMEHYKELRSASLRDDDLGQKQGLTCRKPEEGYEQDAYPLCRDVAVETDVWSCGGNAWRKQKGKDGIRHIQNTTRIASGKEAQRTNPRESVPLLTLRT